MPWRFDPIIGDLVFKITTSDISDTAEIDLGDSVLSDLSIDAGDRMNDSSIVDQGVRK